MVVLDISGGAPIVHRAGPWLPADATQVTACLSTTSFMISPILLEINWII